MSYIEGTAAQNLTTTVQNLFCDWLRGALNAEPYATQIGKPVTVTPYASVAATLYGDGKAFVWVEETPLPKPTEWRDGSYIYRHYEMTLNLDLAASAAESENTTPGGETKADRKLADALTAAVQDGFDALTALNLTEASIEADSERQGDGQSRYPHKFTCLVPTRVAIETP
jgi:hypothetical protein